MKRDVRQKPSEICESKQTFAEMLKEWRCESEVEGAQERPCDYCVRKDEGMHWHRAIPTVKNEQIA